MRRKLFLATLGLLAAVACAPAADSGSSGTTSGSPGSTHHDGTSSAGATPPASGEPADPLAEAAETGALVGQARGHLVVSRALYEANDIPGATAHGSHPRSELGATLMTAVDAAGGDAAALETALAEAAGAVEAATDAQSLDATYDAVDGALADAASTIGGDDSGAPAYVGSVIARLLDTAAHEYAEARAEDGTVRDLTEYQDGYGFVREARRQYEAIAGEVEAAGAEEAAEIEEAFDALEAIFAEPMPGATLGPVEDVEARARLIGLELAETVGAVPVVESDAATEVEAIEGILDDVLVAYEAGDAAGAADLAAEAYLGHYELIEAQVIELAPKINAELEPLLGAELRRLINDGASIEEVQAMVDRARELLREALEALEALEGA